MNDTLETVHGFQIVQWTQHWRRISGRWYRDAVAIHPVHGISYLVSFLDEA